MQHGRRGPVPSRVITTHDEDDIPCVSTVSQHQQWRYHFTKVLNVVSQYDECELDLAEQHEVDSSLVDLTDEEDVKQVLLRVKSGKAAGSSGILPEMPKVGQMSHHKFLSMLLALVRAVKRERHVPQDWKDAIFVLVSKKENLHCCDNWQGIALLNVVGKLVGQVIQNCLQQLAEHVLLEIQCGF